MSDFHNLAAEFQMNSECISCDILEGRIQTPGGVIYEDAHWVVDHSISPVVLRGFLIIKPKRHCEQFAELTPEEIGSFAQVLHHTTIALTRVLGPEKVYICSFGDMVRHIHFYVIPRTSDMPAEGLEVLHLMFDGRWSCSDDEAAEVAARVREEVAHLRNP